MAVICISDELMDQIVTRKEKAETANQFLQRVLNTPTKDNDKAVKHLRKFITVMDNCAEEEDDEYSKNITKLYNDAQILLREIDNA